MDEDDLKGADEAILDALADGRATKGALVDWTGYSRNTVYNRLEVLEAGGLIECVHEGTRLFELVEDPRDGDDDQLRSDGVGGSAIVPEADAYQAIADVVQEWRPGNNLDRREQRRAAGRAALEFLRDRDVAQAEEFKRDLEPEHPVDNQSPDTWWTETARVCLKRAAEASLVRLDRDNNDWYWVGDRDQQH
jgi:DNA-binding transcriptional ArsR family regulator